MADRSTNLKQRMSVAGSIPDIQLPNLNTRYRSILALRERRDMAATKRSMRGRPCFSLQDLWGGSPVG
jgi:hypothetical protein